MGDGRRDQTHEQGLGFERPAGEFGMELTTNEVGMILGGKLHHLHDRKLRMTTGEAQPGLLKLGNVLGFDLISMAEPFADDLFLMKEKTGKRTGLDEHILRTQSHGPAKPFDLFLFGKLGNDRVFAVGSKFSGIGARQLQHMPGILDDRNLQSQAYSEKGNTLGADILNTGDFPFNPPFPKAPGNDHPIHLRLVEQVRHVGGVDLCRVDPLHISLHGQVRGGMLDGLVDRGIGVSEGGVLAQDPQSNFVFPGRGDLIDVFHPDDSGPVFMLGIHARVQVEYGKHLPVEPLRAECFGDGIDRFPVVHGEHAVHRHVGEHRNFLPDGLGGGVSGTTGYDRGLDARFHESLDAELGGLGFLLAENVRFQDIGEGDETSGIRTFLIGQFAQGLNKHPVLVIARRAPNLDEDDISGRSIRTAGQGEFSQSIFDLAGDMGNNLHIAPEISALPLAIENGSEDLTGCCEILPGEILIQNPLIRPQIHIGFRAVIENENLSMPIGIEGAGVDVEVALQLDGGDGESLVLQQLGEGRAEYPLAQS